MADIMTSTDLLAIDFSKNKVRTHYFSATKLKENSLLVGVDLSSKVEQVCFKVNDTVYNVQLKPKEFEDFLKDKKDQGYNLYVGMEACGSSNHWAHVCKKLGHEAYIISAESIRGDRNKNANKSDSRDALNIFCALSNYLEGRREYPIAHARTKQNVGRQELSSFRELLIGDIDHLKRHLNGFMRDVTGNAHSEKKSDTVLKDLKNTLLSEDNECDAKDNETIIAVATSVLKGLEEGLCTLEQRIIDTVKEDEVMQRVMTIPGVGAIAAYTLVNSFGDISRFEDCRHAASCMGTAPKGEGTGGKFKVLNTRRKGDSKVKRVLYQSGMCFTRGKGLRGLEQRKMAASYANRIVRIAFALIRDCKTFDDNLTKKRMTNVHKNTLARLAA